MSASGFAGFRGGDEEVGDRHVEEDREQVQLVGVEAPTAFSVEASLHGRDGGLGEDVAGEPPEAVGDFLLGPAVAFADGLEVVGDHGVDVDPGLGLDLGGLGGGSVFFRALTIATPSLSALLYNSITYLGYDVPVLWSMAGECDGMPGGAWPPHRAEWNLAVRDPRPYRTGGTAGAGTRCQTLSDFTTPSSPRPRRPSPSRPLSPSRPHHPSPNQPPQPSPANPLPNLHPLISNPNYSNTIATDWLPLAGARRSGPDRAEAMPWLGCE